MKRITFMILLSLSFLVGKAQYQCNDATVFIVDNQSSFETIDNWMLETACHTMDDTNCDPNYYFLTEIAFSNYLDVIIMFPQNSNVYGYLDFYSDHSGNSTLVRTISVTPATKGYSHSYQYGTQKPGYIRVVFRDY